MTQRYLGWISALWLIGCSANPINDLTSPPGASLRSTEQCDPVFLGIPSIEGVYVENTFVQTKWTEAFNAFSTFAATLNQETVANFYNEHDCTFTCEQLNLIQALSTPGMQLRQVLSSYAQQTLVQGTCDKTYVAYGDIQCCLHQDALTLAIDTENAQQQNQTDSETQTADTPPPVDTTSSDLRATCDHELVDGILSTFYNQNTSDEEAFKTYQDTLANSCTPSCGAVIAWNVKKPYSLLTPHEYPNSTAFDEGFCADAENKRSNGAEAYCLNAGGTPVRVNEPGVCTVCCLTVDGVLTSAG